MRPKILTNFIVKIQGCAACFLFLGYKMGGGGYVIQDFSGVV